MSLKTIRNNTFINEIGRKVILFSERIIPVFAKKISHYWKISGVVNLEVHDHTIKMYSDGDDGIVDDFYYKRDYVENVDLLLFDRLVRKSAIIFDIGANTGIYSILAAKASTSSKIFSFEPHPSNIKRLKKNISLNDLNNITVVEKAVGDDDNDIQFTIPENDAISDVSSTDKKFSESMYEGEIKWKEIKVKQIRIDVFTEQNNLPKVDLIKIDVENYEMQAFSGMEETIKKFRPEIFCELFFNHPNQSYFQNLTREVGYFVYKINNKGLIKTGSDFSNTVEGLNYYFSKYDYGDFFSCHDIENLTY